jgi:tRNA(Ile)-lysidine synthase
MESKMELLQTEFIKLLKGKKNLLAFSGGVDSSALFFLLKSHLIDFDIAIVDYEVRKESKTEVRFAKELATKYQLIAHTTTAPRFQSHFEESARAFRYDFFHQLIEKYRYENLLTAHQLDDKLEWFFMRFIRGAGVVELSGMEEVSFFSNPPHHLIRPLLGVSKDELLTYLDTHQLPYFIDKSNFDEKYERNHFRKHFSTPLIQKYKDGIARTFRYIQEDKKMLLSGFKELFSQEDLYIIELFEGANVAQIADIYLKKLGYLLSFKQRLELKNLSSAVIGRKFAIERNENKLFIAPFISVKLPKEFKEKCRIAKIPPKVRGYIFEKQIIF